METKSKITERKVKSEKFSRQRGTRMRKIVIEEGQSILRSHLEGVYNIPEDLVHFCKGFFSKKNWADWYFKQAIMDPEGYNRSLKPSDAAIYIKGLCNKREKYIVMDPLFCRRECADILRVSILLHEMAHAVTTETHNKRFFDRLKKCEDKARQLGHSPLAKEINKDIKETRKSYKR